MLFIDKKLEYLLPGIKQNVLLANYTTFKIGGPASYFYQAKTVKDLVKAIRLAKKKRLSFFVLGQGSNILISDKGFDGLIIKIEINKLIINNNRIITGAGVLLNDLVNKSIKKGLTGLEWAIGIPGTIGGAVRGNAGAFNHSISDIVKKVKTLKSSKLEFKVYNPKSIKFGYRDSIFKKNNEIILEIELELKKGDKKMSQELTKKYLSHRSQRQPKLSSAGCVFKNPTPGQAQPGENLSIKSAGWLIEQCGLKGKRIGNAEISEKHANFIVNLGNAKAKDVKRLINLCKEKVKERFGMQLEEEIEYLGKI